MNGAQQQTSAVFDGNDSDVDSDDDVAMGDGLIEFGLNQQPAVSPMQPSTEARTHPAAGGVSCPIPWRTPGSSGAHPPLRLSSALRARARVLVCGALAHGRCVNAKRRRRGRLES